MADKQEATLRRTASAGPPSKQNVFNSIKAAVSPDTFSRSCAAAPPEPIQRLERHNSQCCTDYVAVGFHVGVLFFPDFEMLDAFGPMQMLRNLNNVCLGQLTKISTIGYDPAGVSGTDRPLIQASVGPGVLTDCTIDSCPRLDLLIVPGGLGIRSLMHDDKLLTWIATKVRETELVMSICTGAVLLALAGCLDHKHATTNKKAFAWVKQVTSAHPVQWADEARWVEHGKFITSSGVAAGIDAALRLVAVLHGDSVCASVAELSGYDKNLNSDDDPFFNGTVVDRSGKLARCGLAEADKVAETLRTVLQHHATKLRTAILNQQAIKKGLVGPCGGQRHFQPCDPPPSSHSKRPSLHASMCTGTLDDSAMAATEEGGSVHEDSLRRQSDDLDITCTQEAQRTDPARVLDAGGCISPTSELAERLQNVLPPSLDSVKISSHIDYSRAREGLPKMRAKLATLTFERQHSGRLGDVTPPEAAVAKAAAQQPAAALSVDDASRKSMSQQIVHILEDMLLYCDADEGPGSSTYEHTGRPLLMDKVAAAVDAGEPIVLIMAAFPFKSNNPEKTLGTLPDLAEEVALQNIADSLDAIQKIYTNGARMIIISDGIIWNDLFDVPEARMIDYVYHLQRMARRLNPNFEVSALYDFFVSDASADTWDDDRVRGHIFGAYMPSACDMCASAHRSQVQSYMRLVLEDMDSSAFADDVTRFDAAKQIAVHMLYRQEALQRFLHGNLRFQHSIRLRASPRHGEVGCDMFTIRLTGALQAEAHKRNSSVVGVNPLPWQTVAVHVVKENETREDTQKVLSIPASSLDALPRQVSKLAWDIDGIANHAFFVEHKHVVEKYYVVPYEKNGAVQGYKMTPTAFRHALAGSNPGSSRVPCKSASHSLLRPVSSICLTSETPVPGLDDHAPKMPESTAGLPPESVHSSKRPACCTIS